MSEAAAETTKQPDPMEQFREMRDAYLDVWSKSLIQTVNSEDYAKTSGAMLDNYLTVAAPLKEPVEQAMLKTLQQFNMPTSADIVGLSGRLTNIEMDLDNLDAKLDGVEKLLLSSLEATRHADAKMRAQSKLQADAVDAKLDRIEKLLGSLKVDASEKPKVQTVAPAPKSARIADQEAPTAKPVRKNARKGTR